MWQVPSKGGQCVFSVSTLKPRQNDCNFTDGIFKCMFLNENIWISINISLKFVPMGQTNNIPALAQIKAQRHSGDKPLSEPMMVCLPLHICVTRPQSVKAMDCATRISKMVSPNIPDNNVHGANRDGVLSKVWVKSLIPFLHCPLLSFIHYYVMLELVIMKQTALHCLPAMAYKPLPLLHA